MRSSARLLSNSVAKKRHFQLPQPILVYHQCQVWTVNSMCRSWVYFHLPFICLALVTMQLVPLSEALKRCHRQPVVVTTQVTTHVWFVLVPVPTWRPFSCPSLDVSNFVIICTNLCPFFSSPLCHNAGMISCACLCQPDAILCAQLAVCNPCLSSQLD